MFTLLDELMEWVVFWWSLVNIV